MTTSVKDHLIEDCLFDKLNNSNQANGKIFRPWDCAINDATKSIKSSQFLKENSLSLTNSLTNSVTNSSTAIKSNAQPRLPNDYLTEMFNTSCTMNQNSLTAMETIYNHFYRDYLTTRSKNGSTINNDLLNTFTGKMNLKLGGSIKNATSNTLANLADNLISSKQLSSKLSTKLTSETLSTNQLPLNTDGKNEASNRFSANDKNNNQKKPRPKRFRCPYCDDAQFSNNGQLKGHIRTHTGERPFVCDNQACGKTFTRNEELTRHKRIHTGLRPYECQVCLKKFGRKDHLKKHQRTHEKRKLALAKTINSSSIHANSSLSCLTNSLNPILNSSKSEFAINNRAVVRSDKSTKLETKKKLNLNNLPINTDRLTTMNLIGNLQTKTNNFLFDSKQQFTPNNTSSTAKYRSSSIDNQLITLNTANILPLSTAAASSTSALSTSTNLSSISNNFLSSNHSLPLCSLSNQTTTATPSKNSVSSLINTNQSFNNQFSNHSISSSASSECSFNSNSPVITSLNTLPFSHPLYFNPLMLTLPFIQ